jgi:hypothetical protein
MRKIVLTAGLVSGGFLAAMMAVMIPLHMSGRVGFEHGELIGFSTMILSFLSVFVGIRAYREDVGDGAISFGKAFKIGILITLIACAVYVVCWQIVYWGFFPDFLDKYQAHAIAKAREAGESVAAIRKMESDMASFAKLYANPLFNVAVTFLEVFPVGLIETLVSAAILRRRSRPGPPATALA